ncbi:MAG: PIN domain-containing protein [Treponema sp.]|nr:PIN domain-containing protein [Treponema sp.]
MDNERLVYMDCCCLNRPADDQTQDKIRIETDAIIGILFKCFYGSWKLVGSDIVEYEIMKMPDSNKLDKALNLYSVKKENVELNDKIETRALEVQKYALKPLDSLHFASAEYKNVDVLLTVDKDFIKYSRKTNSSLRVENPINWFMEVIENE